LCSRDVAFASFFTCFYCILELFRQVVFFVHLISNTKWMDTFYHNTVLYKTYRTSLDHKLMWRSTVSWAILIPRLIKMISTSNWELFWF
jgi:hypothetical protein